MSRSSDTTKAKRGALTEINPEWKNRLISVFSGILKSSGEPQCSCDGDILLRAETFDCRVLLEVCERDGALTSASFQMALPGPDELQLLKFSCWALLFLKSLFPCWKGLEVWLHESVRRAAKNRRPVQQSLLDYRVTCHFDSYAGVLDYRVVRRRTR
ncbi:MAG: hypothetical protein U1G07_09395 [Verrucomicrobiota bacterium]